MKLSAIYQIFLDCQSVTTDSRNCPDGSLFIALKGESFNGNAFAGKALEDGCAFAIIDEAQYAIEGDRRYILVNDCLQTLQQLANYIDVNSEHGLSVSPEPMEKQQPKN